MVPVSDWNYNYLSRFICIPFIAAFLWAQDFSVGHGKNKINLIKRKGFTLKSIVTELLDKWLFLNSFSSQKMQFWWVHKSNGCQKADITWNISSKLCGLHYTLILLKTECKNVSFGVELIINWLLTMNKSKNNNAILLFKKLLLLKRVTWLPQAIFNVSQICDFIAWIWIICKESLHYIRETQEYTETKR